MVSAADTAPELMPRYGAATNAPINPAVRTQREKLIDIEPPVIFKYSDGFFYLLLGT
jgi:hypothetical protein